MASRRDAMLVAGAIVVAWVARFLPQLTGRVFTFGDAAAYHMFADFSRARFAAGQGATHWNPYVFLGLPASASLADPRPQWLPGPLLGAWDALTLAAPLLPVLLAVLAGAIAAAFLARSLWRASAPAMLLAGLAWLCAPQLLVPLAFGHDAEVVALALMPVVLLAVHHLFADVSAARGRGAALGFAMVLALEVLGGHPQFAAYSGLFAIAFALERALVLARITRLPLFARALAAAAALSSAVWLPAAAYGRDSVRAGAALMRAESATFTAGARDLLSTIWPHAAGFGGGTYFGAMRATDYPHYLGAVLALLAALGFAALGRPARAAALLLGGVIAFALLAALGAHGPFAALASLPFFSAFRTPISWLAPAQLAVILLAARGLDAAVRAPARLLVLAACTLFAAGAWLFANPANPLTDSFATAMAAAPQHAQEGGWVTAVRVEPVTAIFDLGLRAALAALALVALAFARRGKMVALAGLLAAAVLATADLASVSFAPIARSTGERAALAPPAPDSLAMAAAGDSLYRAFPQARATFFSDAWVAWRARQVAGLHGAAPQRWNDLRSSGLLAAPGFVRAIAVKYLPAQGGSPFEAELVDTLGTGVRVLRDALPRVHSVVRVVAFANDDSVIAAMKDPAFEPGHVAYTTDRTIARAYVSSDDATVALTRDEPDHLRITERAIGDVFVVIADLWMPGWTARVDGRHVALARVDHVLRGVAVGAGSHVIALDYVPPGWTVGLWLTRFAWLAMLVAAGLVWRSLPPPAAPPAAPPVAALAQARSGASRSASRGA